MDDLRKKQKTAKDIYNTVKRYILQCYVVLYDITTCNIKSTKYGKKNIVRRV